jgi:hypothetical protein
MAAGDDIMKQGLMDKLSKPDKPLILHYLAEPALAELGSAFTLVSTLLFIDAI